jgi:hypothetical protein
MYGALPPLLQHAVMAWCSVKKSTGTTLPLPLHEDVWVNGGITPRIIDLDTKLWRVVNFTSNSLHRLGKISPEAECAHKLKFVLWASVSIHKTKTLVNINFTFRRGDGNTKFPDLDIIYFTEFSLFLISS